MRMKLIIERPELLDLTVLECLEAWVDANQFTETTERKHRAVIRRLAEHVSNARIRDLKKSDIVEFVARLVNLPDSRTLSPLQRRTMTMTELSAMRQSWLWQKAKTTSPDAWPTLGGATVNRHLEAVKSMLAWVCTHNPTVVNVARDVKRVALQENRNRAD